MGKVYYPQCRAILQVMFDGYGGDEKDTNPLIIPVLPEAATIVRNSYKQADSWELTFDADDFPIDPALVRAGSAEIYLFAVDGITDDQRLINKQFTGLERGAAAEDPQELALQTARAKASKDRFTFGNKPQIAGLFDEHAMELSTSGRWVTISGQDYTALLANRQWPPTAKGRARRIPTGQRIDKLLEQILDEADETGRLALSVENLDPGTLPVVGKTETRGKKRGIPIEQDTSYWDVITKLASRHGLITFIRGLDLVLTRPNNLDEQSAHRIRRMAWGRNLESLEMSRKLGKEQVPAIVIQSYDEDKRRTITVEYPADSYTKVKKSQRTAKKTGKSSTKIRKTDEYQIIPVFGITDRQVLLNMAKNLHSVMGRAERVVRLSTKDLTDLQENPKSLLDLANGDAVTVDFEEFNVDRALLADESKPTEQKYQHLITRGYGEQVALTIAEKYREFQALKRPLRVREATYDYSAGDGISLECELIDYVVVDGIRDADAKEPRKDQRKERKKDGTPVGRTPDQRRADQRQHGGSN